MVLTLDIDGSGGVDLTIAEICAEEAGIVLGLGTAGVGADVKGPIADDMKGGKETEGNLEGLMGSNLVGVGVLITFYIETVVTCEARHDKSSILVIVNSMSQPTFHQGVKALSI
jgi:hypothetical protein